MSKKNLSKQEQNGKNVRMVNSKNKSETEQEMKKRKGTAITNICALISLIILFFLIKYSS